MVIERAAPTVIVSAAPTVSIRAAPTLTVSVMPMLCVRQAVGDRLVVSYNLGAIAADLRCIVVHVGPVPVVAVIHGRVPAGLWSCSDLKMIANVSQLVREGHDVADKAPPPEIHSRALRQRFACCRLPQHLDPGI